MLWFCRGVKIQLKLKFNFILLQPELEAGTTYQAIYATKINWREPSIFESPRHHSQQIALFFTEEEAQETY